MQRPPCRRRSADTDWHPASAFRSLAPMISETELRGTGATPEEWLREYALLALRVNRLVTEGNGGTVLIYQGPPEWEAQVAAEATQPSGCLVEDAGRLLDAVP